MKRYILRKVVYDIGGNSFTVDIYANDIKCDGSLNKMYDVNGKSNEALYNRLLSNGFQTRTAATNRYLFDILKQESDKNTTYYVVEYTLEGGYAHETHIEAFERQPDSLVSLINTIL